MSDTPEYAEPPSLVRAIGVRAIGVRALAANVVNCTVGSGVFVLPATAAAILGAASASAYDGNPDNNNQWADCTAIGLVAGAAVGAGLGAAIGSLFPHWHLRYRTF